LCAAGRAAARAHRVAAARAYSLREVASGRFKALSRECGYRRITTAGPRPEVLARVQGMAKPRRDWRKRLPGVLNTLSDFRCGGAFPLYEPLVSV